MKSSIRYFISCIRDDWRSLSRAVQKLICGIVFLILVLVLILIIYKSHESFDRRHAALSAPRPTAQTVQVTPRPTTRPTPRPTPKPTPKPTAKPYTSGKSSSKKRPTIGNPSHYYSAEDYYFDYYDDFFDYEDAEDYYYAHGGR